MTKSTVVPFHSLAGLAIAALIVGCAAPPAAEDSQPPNIIVIMADDLGYGDVSPFNGWIETPNLDRLAAGGMMLTDFHTSGAVCSPTRAGLVTGRYQHRAGVPAVLLADSASPLYHQGIDSEAHTISEAFRELGYTTAVFGKWHLGYLPQFKPPLHGFDEFRGFVSGNIDYHSHIDRIGRPDWWNGETLEAEDGYLPELMGDHAERFIAEQRDKPWPRHRRDGRTSDDDGERALRRSLRVVGRLTVAPVRLPSLFRVRAVFSRDGRSRP